MSEISHYHSLDERLEGGPPFDALCDKCRSLKLLALFSGPRYGEFFESFEYPVLDVFIGTVAEVRASGGECRFCFLVSAFHDAKHSDPMSTDSLCKGDLEHCILKPYCTDAAMRMEDDSDSSDKESIATSIIVCFQHHPNSLEDRRLGAATTYDTFSVHGLMEIMSLTKKVFGRKSQHTTLGAGSKRTDPETKVNVVDAPHLDHERCNSASSMDSQVQDGRASAMGIQERDFQHVRLPERRHKYHGCMFCLTDASFVGRRRTLSFSSTAQGPRIDWRSLRG